MKVLILKPRLDIPFKHVGPVPPKDDKPLPPIRQHWENFVYKLAKDHESKGHDVTIIEEPMPMLTLDIVEKFDADLTYIPHNDKKRFGGDHRCRYYMQTVFPWLFTIDTLGWGGDASHCNKDPWHYEFDWGSAFKTLQKRIITGETKFEQPEGSYNFEELGDFILVPLQVPHDMTIKYHSPISVKEMADKIADWAERAKVNVVFKPHVLDRGWYRDIITNIKNKKYCHWIDNVPIHTLLKESMACYVINSGVGLEAMLHQIPVVRFGDADYNSSVIKGDINDLTKTWYDVNISNNPGMIVKYMRFYSMFVNDICFDSTIEHENL